MTTSAPLQALHRLALLVAAAVLGFGVLFGVQSWRSAKQAQVTELQTVLTLIAHSVEAYFAQGQADLELLAQDIAAGPGLADLGRAQQLLDRHRRTQPDAAALNLLALDGQFLATSSTPRLQGLPTLAGEPAFTEYAGRLRADPGTGPELSRPLLGLVVKRWVFSLRYPVRDGSGRPVAIVARVMSVEVMKDFWRGAPVLAKASVGLLRDDGYLIGRHPVPDSVTADEMYGRPRDGALRRHLVAAAFPANGYVEGPNILGGAEFANVYQRLGRYPLTVFVAMPVSQFRQAWWARVQVPYALLALLLLATALAWRYAVRRQLAWDAERERADQELVAREREQRFLIDHLMAGVVVHGPDGRVLRCNPQSCELLGLSEAQMTGRAPLDEGWQLLREDGSPLPDDEQPVARVLDCGRAVTGQVVGAVALGRREPRWLLTRADPEFDDQGRLRQVVATFVDVSEQRHAEHRFRMLFENNLDGVLQATPDGRIQAANPAARALLGRSEAALCALHRDELVDPADPRVGELLTERRRTGRAQGRLRMRRGDGSLFEAEVSTVLFTDDRGTPMTSVVLRDATDRQRAEEARAAQAAAEQANRTKTEFVARMSHELRTPLNAILGFAEVMSLDERQPLGEAQRQRLERVRQAGEHLLALINDVLDLSRVEAGLLCVERVPFDLRALAEAALREVSAAAQRQAVALNLAAPERALPPALGDRLRMRQVLLNLLSNAVKYNRPGGRVLLRLSRRDGRLVAEVEDTGPGLTPEQLGALFQPFNRLGRERGAVEGTGIGLVIARGLVELMGGRLEVDSTPGRGSCFRVLIDAAPADGPRGDGEPPAEGLSAAPALAGRVLYIDDDEVNRLLMQAFFGLLPGLQLRLAADGAQGLAMARAEPPDALLIDMMMPGMDGPAVLHALRADPALAATPCIAVSANAMPSEIDEALAAGFDGYVTKPISVPSLTQALSRALGHPA